MITHDREQPVEVSIGDCRCSGDPRPHPDGDLVFLRPKPDLAMGLAAFSAIGQAKDFVGDTEAALYSVFVRYGIVSWNLVNEKGPVPVTHQAIIDRLQWAEGGALVAVKAAELYKEQVLAPLGQPSKGSPPPMPRNGSTSQHRRSGRKTPTSSPQSSPSPQGVGA